MKNTEATKKNENTITLLKSTQSEITELNEDMKHEKIEAELEYEALKEQLKVSVKEMKTLLEANSTLDAGLTQTLHSKLAELELQLESPKKNLMDDLKGHLTSIKKTLVEVISKLDKGNPVSESLQTIQNNLHRYRIKFEILKLKFALGKMELKDATSSARQKASRKIIALRKFIHENEEVAKKNWKNFRHEINEAYSDLQKALH